jgi:DNA-binding NarL/FixJ family response regulator
LFSVSRKFGHMLASTVPTDHTVLLLQSDAQVAARLQAVINEVPGLRVVGLVATLRQAREFLDTHTPPSLLVGDLRLADGEVTCLVQAQRSHGRSGPPKLLVVSLSSDDALLTETMRAGADGYFVQGGSVTEFIDTIAQVLLGEARMTPTIARSVRRHFAARHWNDSDFFGDVGHPLRPSGSELDLLDRLAEGYILSELARAQGSSEAQLGVTLRRIYRKLQLDVCTDTLALSEPADAPDDTQMGWFQPVGGSVSAKLGRANILAAKRAS